MELVTLQQSSTLKSNGDDHNVLSHVKELEETLVVERRHSSEEVRRNVLLQQSISSVLLLISCAINIFDVLVS